MNGRVEAAQSSSQFGGEKAKKTSNDSVINDWSTDTLLTPHGRRLLPKTTFENDYNWCRRSASAVYVQLRQCIHGVICGDSFIQIWGRNSNGGLFFESISRFSGAMKLFHAAKWLFLMRVAMPLCLEESSALRHSKAKHGCQHVLSDSSIIVEEDDPYAYSESRCFPPP